MKDLSINSRHASLVIAASLCSLHFTPTVSAVPIDAQLNTAAKIYQNQNYLLLAFTPDDVPCGGADVFLQAETRDFHVYICQDGQPVTYVGVSKKDGNKISLPLKDYSTNPQRSFYRAVNGNVTYTLTPTNLRVTRGKTPILNQRVIRIVGG